MSIQPIDVIIVAAGSGLRLGYDVPKAFVLLGGKPLFMHSCELFDTHKSIGSIVLVVPSGNVNEAGEIVSKGHWNKKIRIIPGGKERWESVQNGVEATTTPLILVHDAARPFVSHAVIDSVIAKSLEAGYDCVITATPEVDTIRRYENDHALSTIDRSNIVRVGTPQLFKTSLLKEAFLKAKSLEPAPTDEAMLMEASGIAVGIAWGDPLNFKITTKSDMVVAEALCARTA